VNGAQLFRAALALGVLGAALLQGAASAQRPAETARQAVATAAPDVTLSDQDGRRFALKELRGKAVLVAFIYTSCHHVCPLTFESVGAVQKRAVSEGVRDVSSVFITVDPEIDTPEVLRAYASRRGVDFATTVFLTGSEAELRAAWDGFGIKVKRLGRGLVDHPPLTFLVDARGVVRYRYVGAVLDSDTVVADLRNVLQATAK
jgi:protein SCO1/2